MNFPRPTLAGAARRAVSCLALSAVFCVVAGCAHLLDRVLLFPSRGPVNAGGAHRRVIAFSGGAVEVWTGPSRPVPAGGRPDAYMLRFRGNADRAENDFDAGNWTGTPRIVETWAVNYPGYGGSPGEARLAAVGPAALAAYDALRLEAAGRPILVFGTSLGTTAALHVAAHRTVAGVILQNPLPLRQVILRQFGWWNLWLLAGPLAVLAPSALDGVGNARTVRAPGVFLLAENDEIIRPRYQRLVVETYAGPKRTILLPGAHHNDPLDAAALAKLAAALDWMLAPGKPTAN